MLVLLLCFNKCILSTLALATCRRGYPTVNVTKGEIIYFSFLK